MRRQPQPTPAVLHGRQPRLSRPVTTISAPEARGTTGLCDPAVLRVGRRQHPDSSLAVRCSSPDRCGLHQQLRCCFALRRLAEATAGSSSCAAPRDRPDRHAAKARQLAQSKAGAPSLRRCRRAEWCYTWMQAAQAPRLIHGHFTHQPADFTALGSVPMATSVNQRLAYRCRYASRRGAAMLTPGTGSAYRPKLAWPRRPS